MKKKQYGILGLGRFGNKVARELFHKGQEVIAMDKNESVIQGIKDEVTYAYVGDITDNEALKEAGIFDCDVVIIAESTDMESNIIASQVCKSAGIPMLVCKAHNTVHGKILSALGANEVIFPEQDTAIKLVNRLTSKGVLDYFDIGDNISIVGAKAPEKWVNNALARLDLRNRHNITVLAIRRGEKNLVMPPGETVIEKDDILVLFGREDSMRKLDLNITHRT
ncbi:MAG: TrkA family potassium uptake protein [Candidatus Saganbacteria bacterium]|nr:TrkA family potassium uptake protein [Candidatus Saganbacteria bacterium]